MVSENCWPCRDSRFSFFLSFFFSPSHHLFLDRYGGMFLTGNLTGVLLGPLILSLLNVIARHLSNIHDDEDN